MELKMFFLPLNKSSLKTYTKHTITALVCIFRYVYIVKNFRKDIPIFRGLPGRGPKSLNAFNAELDSVCKCLLNESQRKHPLLRQGWLSSPRIFLASGVANDAFQCHFWSLHSNTPTPSPSKKISHQICTDLKNGPDELQKG